MIRTLVTAHINSLDLHELTIQINDRSLGYLTAQKQQNYVASTNRRVQMVSGIRSDRLDQESIVRSRDLLRKWATVFRELQIYGLDVFPSILKREQLHADFLFLICDEIVLVLVSRYLGLYLHRNDHLYRLQPATPQPSILPGSFMPTADYYAFVPAEGDLLLALDPDFVDLFEPQGLEEILSDPRQMTVKMSELSNLVSAYGYASDHTWVGFQVTRIEQPFHTRKSSLKKISTHKDHLSRVVPVADSNYLLTDESREQATESVSSKVPVPVEGNYPRLSRKHRLGEGGRAEEKAKISRREADPNYERRPSSQETQREYEEDISAIDRIKMLELKKSKRLWESFLYRLTHLFPSSRPLSALALICVTLMILVIIVLIFTGIKSNKNVGKPNQGKATIPLPSLENEADDTIATDFEIKLSVKAQSMQIMSSPGSSDLIATATRGETVWQLTREDKDGWVMVRLTDGRTGYVPLAVLLPDQAN